MSVKNFNPNAFLVLKFQRPILLYFPALPLTANIVVYDEGLLWSLITDSGRNSREHYMALMDFLSKNLPKEKHFKGGLFYAEVKGGKLAPWEVNTDNLFTEVMHLASRRQNDICVKNLRVVVGDYAGQDIGSVVAKEQRKTEENIFFLKQKAK